MRRYARAADVAAEVPAARVGQSGSQWTDDVVEAMADEATAQIKVRIMALGIDLDDQAVSDVVGPPYGDGADPADADLSTAQTLLRGVARWLVAARIFRALPGSETDTRADDVERLAYAELRRLSEEPELLLGGGSGVGGVSAARPSGRERDADYRLVEDIRW